MVHSISNVYSVLYSGNLYFEHKEEYVNRNKLGNILPHFRVYFVNICSIFHIQAETSVV
jgi:hypothetical protein